MWRKPNEVKPSSQAAPTPVATPIRAEEPIKPVVTPVQPVPSQPTPLASAVPTPAPVPQSRPVASNVSKISSGLKINGELSGDADLYVDGEVKGKIRLTGAALTIGPNGRVQAELEAREISIEGSVQGNLKASQSVRLGSASNTIGAISAPRIGIDDGARLRGKIETVRSAQPGKAVSGSSDAEEIHAETVGAKSE